MSTYLNLKPVELSKLSAKRRAAVNMTGRIGLPKYDGCLALMLWEDGKLVDVLSRDGKPVVSMAHLTMDLLYTYPWLAEAGSVCLIGEAWIKGKEFKYISGTFRRRSVQPELQFAPFDVVPWAWGPDNLPVLHSPLPYEARLKRLTNPVRTTCMIHPPRPIIIDSGEEAVQWATHLKASPDGYDGCIVSDPAAPYVVSDGMGEFIKIKPLQSFTLEVVGVLAAVGEKTGRPTVSLQVRFKSGVCGVGTGFTNDVAAAWAAHPERVIGGFVEVGCMGVYDGEQGMMREPRFLGFRYDVTKADY